MGFTRFVLIRWKNKNTLSLLVQASWHDRLADGELSDTILATAYTQGRHFWDLPCCLDFILMLRKLLATVSNIGMN